MYIYSTFLSEKIQIIDIGAPDVRADPRYPHVNILTINLPWFQIKKGYVRISQFQIIEKFFLDKKGYI